MDHREISATDGGQLAVAAEQARASAPLSNAAMALHESRWGHDIWDSDTLLVDHSNDVDLNGNIAAHRESLYKTPAHLRQQHHYCELGELLYESYQRTGDAASLDEAIALETVSLELGTSSSERPRCLVSMMLMLKARFRRTLAVRNMARAVQDGKNGVDPRSTGSGVIIEEGHQIQVAKCNDAQDPVLLDLRQAVEISKEAIHLVPIEHSDHAEWLHDLGFLLLYSYNLTGSLHDLDEAIGVSKMELEAASDEMRPFALDSLAVLLNRRFEETHLVSDILEGINRSREAARLSAEALRASEEAKSLSKAELVTEGNTRARYLYTLAEGLFLQYKSYGEIVRLDEAIHVTREALELDISSNAQDVRHRRFLGRLLYDRYKRTDNIKDLEEAISAAGRIAWLLYFRYNQSEVYLRSLLLETWIHDTGAMPAYEDLSEGVETPANVRIFGITLVESLHELAHRLHSRWVILGESDDLRNSIHAMNGIVDMSSNFEHQMTLSDLHLGMYLERRYVGGQPLNSLQEAIRINRKLVDASSNDAQRVENMLCLSISLSFYHQLTGDVSFLPEAIRIGKQVVEMSHELDGRFQVRSRISLGQLYFRKSRASGLLLPDLLQAVEILQAVLDSETLSETRNAALLDDITRCFLWHHQITDSIASLDVATTFAQRAVDVHPERHEKHNVVLHRLALVYHERYLRTKALVDLEEAIKLETKSIGSHTSIYNLKSPSRINLASLFCERYLVTSELPDLEKALKWSKEAKQQDMVNSLCYWGICEFMPGRLKEVQAEELLRQARSDLEASEPGHIHRPQLLSSLALILSRKEDFEEGILLGHRAIQSISSGDPDLPWCLSCMAKCLDSKFFVTRGHLELHESIELARRAVSVAPKDSCGRPFYLLTLATGLYRRYGVTARMADLHESISLSLEACDMIVGDDLSDHYNRHYCCAHLALCFHDKYLREGTMSDLLDGTRYYQNSMACIHAINADPAAVNNMPDASARYYDLHLVSGVKTGSTTVYEPAVHVHLPDPVECRDRLHRLGEEYFLYYEQFGTEHQLQMALWILGLAFSETPLTHITRPSQLYHIGRCHEERYFRLRRNGSNDESGDALEDLNKAIKSFREIIETVTETHPVRPETLKHLGQLYPDKLSHTWEMSDLKIALEVHQECLDKLQEHNPERATWIKHLGSTRLLNYQTFGNICDLDEAATLLEEGVALNPADVRLRSNLLKDLGYVNHVKFTVYADVSFLSKALQLYHDALDICPESRSANMTLASLGNGYLDRYMLTESPMDLEKATTYSHQASDMLSSASFEKPRRLADVAKCHLASYNKAGRKPDLELALDFARQAVELAPPEHTDHLYCRRFLADCYLQLFKATHSKDDFEQAVESLEMAFDFSPTSNVPDMLSVAQTLLAALIQKKDFDKALDVASHAVSLLPNYAGRFLQFSEAHVLLSKASGLASQAAALSLDIHQEQNARETLGILERGRGIIAEFLYDLRIDKARISRINKIDRWLAGEFLHFRTALSVSGGEFGVGDGQSALNRLTRQIDASQRLGSFIENWNMQHHPQFRLKASNTNYAVLTKERPVVVINVSYRCDAFLIRNEIEVLPLPTLSQTDIDQKAQYGDLGSLEILEWLWDAIAEPVLNALGFVRPPVNGRWPRICWVVTGKLSRFPLHAAGRHTGFSGDTVLDRVVSSYSPTVQAVMEGFFERQRPLSTQAVIVAMEHTPGSSGLPFATQELSIVREMCQSMSLVPREPERRTEEVLAHLDDCEIFHFAGHGQTDDKNPLNSHLRLEDWESRPLQALDLLNMNLRDRPPFLAYLSACGTSRIRDENFLDEGMHLMGVCQLAGFRHVIGTLWEVYDETCVDVARITYEKIRAEGMTDESVSLGLHEAVRRLRDQWLGDPSDKQAHGALSGTGKKLMVKATNPNLGLVVEGSGGLRLARDITDADEDLGPSHWATYVHYGA